MAPSTTDDVPQVSQTSADIPERPKHESILTEEDRAELAFTDKRSAPDVYINGNTDTLWFPWVGPIELKPLRMENRTGTFVVALRSPVDAWLGKHRHRGSVTALTVSGEWRYKEYDWVARPGDYVCENPGTIHTLFVGGNTEVVFTITGSLEFLNDDDSLKTTLDIFSFAKMYYDHCKDKGLKPNDGLWF
ncbi:RmlC-like cupin domain-containing protein [Dactylonectria macrodidyma]|uniref:RmlC-like cupin domain-containing protein n=1 Tax=Dactylonectria macrodidyma TaxID=307937 RepID=A0A9P9D4S9_9HYPO|nr:RmlC-like cupin domain-containing protein [Dactylonectria macrodidyma]